MEAKKPVNGLLVVGAILSATGRKLAQLLMTFIVIQEQLLVAVFQIIKFTDALR